MKIYDKLVRDCIPDIIARSGSSCEIRTLSHDEYMHALDAKLVEEVYEFQEEHNVEELADLLEVIYAAAAARFVTAEQLDALRAEKAAKRGRFEKRIFLERVYDKPQPKKYTLDEIATKICNNHCENSGECTEDCIGFNFCAPQKNGALAWLRKVVNGE